MPRIGNWMQTASGRQFWPLDPRADEIHIEDIAHALSNQCRFAGHCREFYSVAEHSARVSRILPPDLALVGLLHDASEAYLMDLPRPIKRDPAMVAYREAEERVEYQIAQRFGLSWPWPDAVHHADNVLLATEARDLMAPPPVPWVAMPEPDLSVIYPWSPKTAREIFLTTFRALCSSK